MMRNITYEITDKNIAYPKSGNIGVLTEQDGITIDFDGINRKDNFWLNARHECGATKLVNIADEVVLGKEFMQKGKIVLDLYLYDKDDDLVKMWILLPLKIEPMADRVSAKVLATFDADSMLEYLHKIDDMMATMVQYESRLERLENALDDPTIF